MPTLRCFFAIYTDGSSPSDTFEVPRDSDVFLGEMAEVIVPTAADELFGPAAASFTRFKPKRGFLLGVTREVKGRAGSFFDDARKVLLESCKGLSGVGLDVLRLWPFPLDHAESAIPDDLLAEDLFSVGFSEMGVHGFRAETFGFAKLGQRELSFEFTGRELLEEAALMCGHLADWLLEHGRRLEHGNAMAFGFDRISFASAEGATPGTAFRGWHPLLQQKLLPQTLFPGVGVLEVLAQPHGAPDAAPGDLTIPLERALAQRLLLEELDLTGDSPHATSTAAVYGTLRALADLTMWREEVSDSKDSGWRFKSALDGAHGSGVQSLADVARRIPDVVRFLALPHGVRLTWNGAGTVEVDLSKTHRDDDHDLDDDD